MRTKITNLTVFPSLFVVFGGGGYINTRTEGSTILAEADSIWLVMLDTRFNSIGAFSTLKTNGILPPVLASMDYIKSNTRLWDLKL